jgi:hypothetical protein
MIDLDHPFFFLEPLFAKEGATFHFSRYVYTPDSLFDERELLEVAGHELTVEWLESATKALGPSQELAIHSLVTIGGRKSHIPMIDFAAHRLGEDELGRIRAFLPSRVFKAASFYHSGRSFHAYSTNLLEPKEWYAFLGRILLINPSNGDQIVDARWVGHRLIAGYCSLRFSNNSRQYMGMPRKMGIRSLIEGKSSRLPEPHDEISADQS